MKISGIYTCFNRKEKTLRSLKSLFDAHEQHQLASNSTFELVVYLTDDGSTDGTAEAVAAKFPQVKILKAKGDLFWAEGMRNSWKAALKEGYDAYLLLNDDVELYQNLFPELLKTDSYCRETLGKPGICIGATEDKAKKTLTYSGSIILNKFLYTQKRLTPNGDFQECELANANIMFVPNEVVTQIGILSEGYSHGIADYDYSLTANRNGIPVIIAPEYLGHCENDHADMYEDFSKLSLKERRNKLYKPTGLAYESYLKYMKKFFPLRYPMLVLAGWLKLYFPGFYVNVLSRKNRYRTQP
ncbi:MAG: glycosyltransferase family 2 protein [Bacteroidota bacterium]